MSEQEKKPVEMKNILSSRIRLARNFNDIPFHTKMNAEQAQQCVDRVLNVLRDFPENYQYYPMRGISAINRQDMVESHEISPDLFRDDDLGAALVREDRRVIIMVNEEDHLRIQSFCPGLMLPEAADNAYEVEDALQRKLSFAFDEQWGYLTACPTNTGTGMRASVMLHLPMLTYLKQMGKVTQLAAKLGLTLRGIYGEGSEALGNVYQLSNQVTLGRTESEIIDAVTAVAKQMTGMEDMFRQKTLEKDSVSFEDQLFRSLGLLKGARRMPLREFMTHWSNLRMGSAMNMLPYTVKKCDSLLEKAQSAHLQLAAGHDLEQRDVDIARSTMLRAELDTGLLDDKTEV